MGPVEPDRKPDAPNARVPRAYDVLLRAVPRAISLIELDDLRALAAAQYPGAMLEELEAAIAIRVSELVRREEPDD